MLIYLLLGFSSPQVFVLDIKIFYFEYFSSFFLPNHDNECVLYQCVVYIIYLYNIVLENIYIPQVHKLTFRLLKYFLLNILLVFYFQIMTVNEFCINVLFIWVIYILLFWKYLHHTKPQVSVLVLEMFYFVHSFSFSSF